MKSIFNISIFLILVTLSCHSYKPSQGKVRYNSFRLYNQNTHSFIKNSLTTYTDAWFYGDKVIIENVQIVMTDTSTCRKILKYIFCDRKTGFFYDFPTFDSDSNYSKKYFLNDSSEIPLALSFYLLYKSKLAENATPLTDTTINNIEYKRFEYEDLRQNRQDGNGNLIGEFRKVHYKLLARTDKPNTHFHLNRTFDIMHNCNLVREDYSYDVTSGIYANSDLEYLRDTLTKEEMNVFKSWIKKCK